MSEVEIDSYYAETVDSDRALTAAYPSGSGALAYGETFKPSVARALTSCKFRLKKLVSPSGTLRAYLYAHSGDFGSGIPTGDPLATSDPITIEDLTTTYTLKTFTFDGLTVLEADTPYVLVVYSTDGNLDGTNYVRVAAVAVGEHEGNGVRFLSAIGYWQAYSTIDVMFYAYGITPYPFWRLRD